MMNEWLLEDKEMRATLVGYDCHEFTDEEGRFWDCNSCSAPCTKIRQAQLRKVVVELVDGKCPHTGGLEEEQMHKIDCPKCWQSLRKEAGL
jgi:hypothetical protein